MFRHEFADVEIVGVRSKGVRRRLQHAPGQLAELLARDLFDHYRMALGASGERAGEIQIPEGDLKLWAQKWHGGPDEAAKPGEAPHVSSLEET